MNFDDAVMMQPMGTSSRLQQFQQELKEGERSEIMKALANENKALREQKDGAYSERNKLVALLTRIFPSSIEKHDGDDWEDDWRNVVFIDFPAGQASWHIHDSELPLFAHLQSKGWRWDSHTTDEKYERIAHMVKKGLATSVKVEVKD